MWADPSMVEEAKQYLADAPNVTVQAMPINEGWLRDWGPTCIARKNPETGKREVSKQASGIHLSCNLLQFDWTVLIFSGGLLVSQ